MTSFILLYAGPPATPEATHEGWPEGFESLGDNLIDRGSPMIGGFVTSRDGTTGDTAASVNGYSIIGAADRDAVRDLLRNHPFLITGSEHRIEVFEVPAK